MLRSIDISSNFTANEFLEAIKEPVPTLSRFDGTIPVECGCDHFDTPTWDIFPPNEWYYVIDYVSNGYSFLINPNLISSYEYFIENFSQ